jgi:diguanylate cyclase (GGDEF)-like protein
VSSSVERDDGDELPARELLAEVEQSRAPVLVHDAHRDPRTQRHRAHRQRRTWLGVPLIAQDRVAGILTLERAAADGYTVHDAEIAFTFAGQAGVAIENARLFAQVRRLATTDGLTGLCNRRRFFDLAEAEFARAKQRARPLSAIMLDVDHFKKVNDRHGHAVGDRVLQAVAQRCRDALRPEDVMGRYGGEEFAIVLPETGLDHSHRELAEGLRLAVASEPIATDDGPVTVTISLGVATATSTTSDLAALLDAADGALYEAKRQGRNRALAARGGQD